MRQLYRSRRQRMIAGVCGGIAEYFGTDPTLVRLIWVVLSLPMFGFVGVLAYLICWAVIPPAGAGTPA